MFTGIIETKANIVAIQKEGSNIHFTFESGITDELKIDQSVAHDGVCLTVVAINGKQYTVTAIDETLKKTNLGSKKVGDCLNIERCMPANGRYDGHIVQGHVDTVATCILIEETGGSWRFGFKLAETTFENLMVMKGSICISGVSLTLTQADPDYFEVAIIPYTFEHTTFGQFVVGTIVNIEFDILGKYIQRHMQFRK
jgi:riboflavin synthase